MGWVGLLFNTITAWEYLFLSAFIFYVIRKKNALAKYFFIIAFIIYFGFYSTSILLMNYANRFAFQLFYPAIIFALIITVNHLTEKDRKRISWVMILFLTAITAKGFYDRMPIQFGTIKENMLVTAYMQKTHFTIGNQLAALNNPKIKVVIGDAGVIPYLAHTKCYDPYGLADVFLSKEHLTEEYFNKMDADLLILTGFFKDREKLPIETPLNVGRLYHIIQKQKTTYSFVTDFYMEEHTYNLFFYIKNDSKYKDEILSAIAKAQKQHDAFKITAKDFFTFKYINNYFQK
jgi:hypothetical protein